MSSEFEFIAGLRRKFSITGKKIVTGIGDDAAVIAQNSRLQTVISSDLLVEDIDFKLDWISPFQLGRKALAVSLSDIAAMGAKPLWSIVSVGIPQVLWDADFLKVFYEGWAESASAVGVNLVGGDISKTPEKVVVDSVVGGEVRRNRAVKRSGASPGDLLYVTGELGGAAAGLKALFEDIPRNEFIDSLIARQLEPSAQTRLGRTLGEKQIASAMIDVSDGLLADLQHLCCESGVGAVLHESRIPVDKNILLADFAGPLDFALNGGEDFELLFTVPRRLPREKRAILEKLPVTEIGLITEEKGVIRIENEDGAATAAKPRGFRHF